jgi:S-adenosylmethionine:tRNA ribosyltransferase-isomerase
LDHLNLNQFNFELPDKLIAHEPAKTRDTSRLLHFNRSTETIDDLSFKDIINVIPENSCLVLNNTKVIKARVYASRKTGAKIECFFLEKVQKGLWKAMLKNSKRITEGEELMVSDHQTLKVISKSKKEIILEIIGPLTDFEFLDAFGNTPLPPYIKSKNTMNDIQRYQSVFASEPGAVAAPTASLHFTDEIFIQLSRKKIEILYITLHIGLGTFNPIQSENILDHKMHYETYKINQITATKLNEAKKKNKPIFAVGTTVARCLESNISDNQFSESETKTNLFIYPGYAFKAINGLLTNFHLPKSSLFILISSLIGIENTKKAYQHAIDEEYRFFSYGDAMIIT